VIAIVDYGMGNLGSVAKGVARVGGRAGVTSDPARIRRANGVIFPGVGAFGEAMRELKRRRLVAPLLEAIERGTPFLGLCLGLQLLFERSEESPGARGLGVFPGVVRKLRGGRGLKVPHMGWNQIEPVGRDNPLLKGVPRGAFMYFIHGYCAEPKSGRVTAARTRYGRLFPSVVWDGGSVWATQFHPEKSQTWGLRILKNYVEWCSC